MNFRTASAASTIAGTVLLAPWQALAQEPAPKPKLAWAPPTLTDPVTVEVSESKTSLKLDQSKDYIVKLPADKPLRGGLRIWGGRNVVLIGGEISIPSKEEAPDFKGETRALYLNQQKGTAHVEGLLMGGKGMTEGINLDQRQDGATVQLQNVRIETVHGSREGNHADLIQTWAGPSQLRIDRFTGSTSYQGFFLLPNQHFKDGPQPRLFDFRHLNLSGNEKSAYLLWRPNPPSFPLSLQDVWLAPNPKKKGDRDSFLWPKPSTGDTAWAAANVGTPPEGDFVPEGVAGVNYVSPGYLEQPPPTQ